MKSTMKKSPIKQGLGAAISAAGAAKKATEVAASAKTKKSTAPVEGKPNAAGGEKKKGFGGIISSLQAAKAKKETTTKTAKPNAPEGKPNASTKPTGRKVIDTVKKVAATAAKGAVAKTALTQLKKPKR